MWSFQRRGEWSEWAAVSEVSRDRWELRGPWRVGDLRDNLHTELNWLFATLCRKGSWVCNYTCIPEDAGLKPHSVLDWQNEDKPDLCCRHQHQPRGGHSGSPSAWVFLWLCSMLFCRSPTLGSPGGSSMCFLVLSSFPAQWGHFPTWEKNVKNCSKLCFCDIKKLHFFFFVWN